MLYSLNGQYFKDFGVYVSASQGLMGKPKPKARKTYDWKEYHGKAVDTDPLQYDEREISLQCFVVAEDWGAMHRNTERLFAEFERSGLSRLVLEYMGKALVFDVYLDGEIALKKTFRKGIMVGEFTLKMKEPEPVKRSFKLSGTRLELRFESPSWITVSIDGESESYKGTVNLNKTLRPRSLSSRLGDADMHYISLSGEVKTISQLFTNAEELWN